MPHSDYLERQLRRLVRPQIRNAGEFLYDDVLLKQGNQFKVIAQVVEGKESLAVTLSRRGPDLWVDCSCPGRRSRSVCPHIWAAILAADAKSYLLGMIGDDLNGIQYSDDVLESVSSSFIPALSGKGNGTSNSKVQAIHPPKPEPDPEWKRALGSLQFDRPRSTAWPAEREIYYIVQRWTAVTPTITVQLRMRDRTTSGGWGKLKRDSIEAVALPSVQGHLDREILTTALGSDDGWSFTRSRLKSELRLAGAQAELLLPKMCQTRRCLLQWETPGEENLSECLLWDDGPPWKFRLAFQETTGGAWRLTGYFVRSRDRLEFEQAVVVSKAGLLVTSTAISRLHVDSSLSWIELLRSHAIVVRKEEGERFLQEFVSQPFVPDIDWPEDLRPHEIRPEPSPIVRIADSTYSWNRNPPMDAVLSFHYGETEVLFGKGPHASFDASGRQIVWRNIDKERQFGAILTGLGLKFRDDVWQAPSPFWQFTKKKLPAVLSELMSQKWRVEVAGRAFREGGPVEAALSSGIDWFDLDGFMEFGGGQRASIPELLRALELNQRTIDLPDGSIGIIPADFEARYGALAGIGRTEGQAIRFARNSASLLDALLASQEEVKTDAVFARMRENLARFQGIEPAPQPGGFEGQLRDYQREGLAWMHFLREFGFGGCLADDMGVGKTAQVLALLETRRELRDEADGNAPAPSLAVVPRSLIYNWKQESARFAPRLRILDYSGAERRDSFRQIAGYDLVLCTYGTMRRDIVELQKLEFDYIILDEAQAIKNRDSDSAKAARLLKGRQKLALSGTPVENHLGELWSLFEFLNPGMLGSSSAFRAGKRSLRNPDGETRKLLGRAVRPFLLRRTKSQVARELPPKIEQTLYCELPADQRRLYNELRDHYRRQLLGRVEQDGIGKSKIQILKALLRLRQAACHPALLQRGRSDDMSAKLESLLPQLAEISSEGHKTLIFSQFTSFLDIVRKHLDRQQLTYSYLDGQTVDRQAVVERFQNDPECPLFLVSLKAGGVGLNLTAAEYVFLLDPWWNPAVEAQAIDRTHRIGQSNTVFAYRMIARDTVEEKVLKLQNRKRDLAASIICEDNRLVGNLQREDLELLLS
jgi:superfamily II DNA or RNA helicase